MTQNESLRQRVPGNGNESRGARVPELKNELFTSIVTSGLNESRLQRVPNPLNESYSLTVPCFRNDSIKANDSINQLKMNQSH